MENNPMNDPEMVIQGLVHEMRSMGNNDSEFDKIETILARLRAGEISGPEAVKQAHLIRSSKIDR